MSPGLVTLLVLVAVVAAMIWDKVRADVVALAGAAVLLMTGVVRPIQAQSAFASPAIVTLAALTCSATVKVKLTRRSTADSPKRGAGLC